MDAVTHDEKSVDQIFHALSDATRRDILTRVIRHEQSVSELAVRYAMSFAAVQKHVAVLERAALVVKERRGKQQIVHGELSTVHSAAQLLGQYEQLWIARTQRIGDILTEHE